MEIINNIKDLKTAISALKAGGSVGFVPTMGALHKGHISLVERCRKDNSVVVVSVFVNPTQFNDKNDLAVYPRTEREDAALLEANGCDILFLPSVEQMYPAQDDRVFDFGVLDKVMEGVNRPGHFNGVWQIVSKLFDCVEPNRAYFGEKDFQQLAIIRKMTKDFGYAIEIVGCDICRAEDGLALSSRNMLLSNDQRASAPKIFSAMSKAAKMQWSSVEQLQQWVVQEINSDPQFEVEYFELSDEETLQPVADISKCNSCRGFIVVRAGKVRLIDNFKFI